MINQQNPTSDRILPATRWLAAVIIPFLVVAFIILYFWPDKTAELFAWPIQPPLTAMLLAAAYAGGIYFFTAVLLARQWHTIKAGFLPVTAFASLLGIATLLHWDRFTHDSISFIAWAGLYFTTPFLVIAVWLYNRRINTRNQEAGEVVLRGRVRNLFAGMGILLLIVGLGLFIFPNVLISFWPWKLTPLTARVLGAMFTLPGILGLEFAVDPRWSTALRLMESQFFSLLFMFVALLRSRADFGGSDVGYWISVGVVVGIILIIAWVYLYMRAKNRNTAPAMG